MRRYIIENEPTVEVLLARPEVIGSAHLVAIGTPQDIVDQIVTFMRRAHWMALLLYRWPCEIFRFIL